MDIDLRTHVKIYLDWNKQGRSFSASNPFNNLFVNVFSVNNSGYPHFISLNFVDYPIIADSQFPVSLESFSERLSILMGGY